jgi:hypothetical protein
MPPSTVAAIGGRITDLDSLISWFGRMPTFHDATILELGLCNGGSGVLRIHAFEMTDCLDDEGYFILDKHAVIRFDLEGVLTINLTDFELPGIIYGLTLAEIDGQVEVAWTSSYGVYGSLRAERIHIAVQPGKPEGR